MFWHNFKYSLKTLFRNKMLIFWTFAFPIILGTFFNMAFSNISQTEKFDVINIAIIKNDDFENNKVFKSAIETLSDEENEDRMFNTQYVDLEKAKDLLENDEIAGYLEMKENDPQIVLQKNGINQTIFKYIIEEIMQRTDMVETLTEQEIQKQISSGNYNIDAEKIAKEQMELLSEDINLENTANENLDYMMIEFYTLIAMACLYGGVFGLVVINQSMPNLSNKGKRVAVSPTKKGTVVLSSLMASYITQLIGLAILFLYTIFALHVDYGSNIGLVVLLAVVGSLAGLAIGILVASVFKVSENAKTGILISISMLGCFFSGMMGVTLKYVIDKNIPIINLLNPASMITDGFYSLYYYTSLDRYWFNIASLLIFAFVLLVISFLSIRRQKYDSI